MPTRLANPLLAELVLLELLLLLLDLIALEIDDMILLLLLLLVDISFVMLLIGNEWPNLLLMIRMIPSTARATVARKMSNPKT